MTKKIADDANATDREQQLAQRLQDCGRVLNDLVLALNNSTIVDD